MMEEETPRSIIQGFLTSSATHQPSAILTRRKSRVAKTPQSSHSFSLPVESERRTKTSMKLRRSQDSNDFITPRSMIESHINANKSAFPSIAKRRRRRSFPAPSVLNTSDSNFTPRTNILGVLQQVPEETPFTGNRRKQSLRRSLPPLPDNMTINLPDEELSYEEEYAGPQLRSGRTPKKRKIIVNPTVSEKKPEREETGDGSLPPLPDNLDIVLPEDTEELDEYSGPVLRSGWTPKKQRSKVHMITADTLRAGMGTLTKDHLEDRESRTSSPKDTDQEEEQDANDEGDDEENEVMKSSDRIDNISQGVEDSSDHGQIDLQNRTKGDHVQDRYEGEDRLMESESSDKEPETRELEIETRDMQSESREIENSNTELQNESRKVVGISVGGDDKDHDEEVVEDEKGEEDNFLIEKNANAEDIENNTVDKEGSIVADDVEDDVPEDDLADIEEEDKENDTAEKEGSIMKDDEEDDVPEDDLAEVEEEDKENDDEVTGNDTEDYRLAKTPHLQTQKPGQLIQTKLVSFMSTANKTPERENISGASPKVKSKYQRKRKNLPKSSLSPNDIKKIFTHFCKMKVSPDVLPELINITEKFFYQATGDLEAFTEHARRKIINMSDVEILMRRQGFVTDKHSLNGLVERLLPLELRKEIIPVARAGNIVTPL